MDGVPAARNYEGGFHAELMVKDLGLAAAAAQDCGAPLHMGRLAAELYKRVCPNAPLNSCARKCGADLRDGHL